MPFPYVVCVAFALSALIVLPWTRLAEHDLDKRHRQYQEKYVAALLSAGIPRDLPCAVRPGEIPEGGFHERGATVYWTNLGTERHSASLRLRLSQTARCEAVVDGRPDPEFADAACRAFKGASQTGASSKRVKLNTALAQESLQQLFAKKTGETVCSYDSYPAVAYKQEPINDIQNRMGRIKEEKEEKEKEEEDPDSQDDE